MKLQPSMLPRITSWAPTPTDNQIRTPAGMRLGRQGQTEVLLAFYPLPKLSELYPIVFERILREQTSTLPVKVK